MRKKKLSPKRGEEHSPPFSANDNQPELGKIEDAGKSVIPPLPNKLFVRRILAAVMIVAIFAFTLTWIFFLGRTFVVLIRSIIAAFTI